jgi:DNA-binding transcriptional LysR family regulator
MNLRALRTFTTTVEAGGLGRACARLHLSQPAASRQIRSLEVELGVALFQRVGRRLQLTSDGEDLLQQSRME